MPNLVLEAPVAMKLRRPASSSPEDRDLALDFTKGVLVLFMILYHWINYFVVSDGSIYRYLRFITPSFIFLTGFLIANVYLKKYLQRDLRPHKRLAIRGIKLIALFTLLNLAAHFVASQNYNGSRLGINRFIENLFSIYVVGDGRASVFDVLVPISYLLLLSALLVCTGRSLRRSFQIACTLCFGAVFALSIYGILAPNLELLGIGLLGIMAGHISRRGLEQLTNYTPIVLVLYGLYLIAITLWDVLYILQVVGVCLSLLLMYMLGARICAHGLFQKKLLLLGRYSLLSYVAQIVLLQVLIRILHPSDYGNGMLILSFVATLGLTHLTVELIEAFRQKSHTVDHLYRFVFA